MNQRLLVLNIETIGDPDLPSDLLPEVPDISTIRAPINYKDPEKIKEYIAKAYSSELQKAEDAKSEFSLSPLTGKIICMSFKCGDGNVISWHGDCEEALLTQINNLFDKVAWDLLVTYNGKSFDIPFIYKGLLRYRMTPGFSYYTYTKRYDTLRHLDVYEVLSDFGQNKKGKLHQWATRLDVYPVYGRGTMVNEWWQKGQWDDIKKHCESNVAATYGLARLLL